MYSTLKKQQNSIGLLPPGMKFVDGANNASLWNQKEKTNYKIHHHSKFQGEMKTLLASDDRLLGSFDDDDAPYSVVGLGKISML